MVKTKLSALLLIIAIVSVLMFSGCAENDSKASGSENNVSLSSEYNADDKAVDVVLMNNTENSAVTFIKTCRIYKKDGDKEINITPAYAAYGTATMLLPDSGINSAEISFPVYNTASDDGSININEAKEKASLESGQYVVAMDVDVYENPNYKYLPDSVKAEPLPENPEGKYIDSDSPYKTITVKSEFKVA